MKTAILLICSAAAMHAQLLEGSVYDALTGAPLPGVVLSTNAFSEGPTARTDASGVFRMQLPSNHAPQLTAEKAGYLESVDEIGEWHSHPLRIELNPEAVIAGTVLDEDGFPAGGSRVFAMHYRVVNGERKLSIAASGETDEQGNYRIDNLAAGRYYIRVYSSDANNWDPRYVPQYLGGTLQPDDGHLVEVKYGETLKDVDVRLARYEGVTVSGRLEGVPANPRGPGPVVALLGEMLGRTYGAVAQGTDSTFAMRHVPPGTYKLRYGLGNRPGDLFAQLNVEVGERDVRDLVIAPHVVQLFDLEGQVVVREGGLPGPWMVTLQPSGPGVTVQTNEDGAFIVQGLLPQHYTLFFTTDTKAPQWKTAVPGHVVAVTLGDRDVWHKGFDLDGPSEKQLRITISNRWANIGGSMVDSEGVPLANTRLYFRSTQTGLLGTATTDDKGSFYVLLAEAGDYRVYTAADEGMAAQNGDALPLIHVALGDNPPATLVRNPRPE